MPTEFPLLNHGCDPSAARAELSALDKSEMVNDFNRQDLRHGRGPYIVNGLPISQNINGCCIKNPCFCRSDVIFYNGKAYDQKPYIHARLRTRPGDVMYLEGKLTPPFNPGKAPQKFGPYRSRDPKPSSMCFNDSQFGKGLSRCCTTSIYSDTFPPYHNVRSTQLAYTDEGLPYGDTIGYFRFKPEPVCDCGTDPVMKLTECCSCEMGEYNPAQYAEDECPAKRCCC